MSFKPVNNNNTIRSIWKEVLEYWESEDIFQKIIESRKNSKKFIFLEGPPTANGRPHVGHALTRAMKDTALRYKTMKGYNIERRDAGWDCHGLPVELEAEKHFGFKSKDEIEKFGVEKFNKYCRESVFRYIDDWNQVDRNIGYWINRDSAYVTLRDDYIESEWWALKTLFERKDMYKDFRISPYCPRCETTLSSHELAQGYKNVKDTSIYVKFKLNDEDRYALAWTTTPWTIPSNLLLAVNSRIEYSDVEYKGSVYIVASNLAKTIFPGQYRILKTYLGKELLGKKYVRPIEFLDAVDNACMIVDGNHVTLDEGTGIVHTAPAFGSDDFDLGKKHGTGLLNPVDVHGRFNDAKLPWNGLFVKDADISIVKYLKEKGLVLKSEKYEHSYPFCYRCDTPLLYYPIDAWFIRVSAYSKDMVEYNSRINWVPNHLKNGRFGNFIEDAKDWNLSRNRYWGTPLPVWTCENGHNKAIGSKKELLENGATELPQELHRPYVDNIFLKCGICGGVMKREPFVIDTWFDSGSATYAALHYPHERTELPELPISYIAEAIDQTRGWFYTLHAISTMLFRTNAFENVLCAEFILDETGKKMSKSKGNGILAMELLDRFGADSSRLFFYSTAVWKPKPLVEKIVRENETKILGTLLNLYNFFASNATLDDYVHKGILASDNLLDRWLLSRINTTISNTAKAMESYEFHDAQRHIANLIEETSNSYLRLSRRRFWDSSTSQANKFPSYSVLFTAIETICLLLAPIAPFTTEYIYRNLHENSLSVHAATYPEQDSRMINPDLENSMESALTVLELTRRARQSAGIKGRQPVKSILIYAEKITQEGIDSISEELNAKTISVIGVKERPSRSVARVNMPVVAPLLKANLNSFLNLVENANRDGTSGTILKDHSEFMGTSLPENSLTFSEVPDPEYTMESDSGIEVYLNREIDIELEQEGMSREIIRRIQIMRKELNLEYDRKIKVCVEGDELTDTVLKVFGERIKEETLTEDLTNTMKKAYNAEKEWDIDGRNVKISILL